uniref:Uncharacterized protein n=1 Tax=Oryza nivara TaxID=4536 RepID=A0A0E0IH69_ORYNI
MDWASPRRSPRNIEHIGGPSIRTPLKGKRLAKAQPLERAEKRGTKLCIVESDEDEYPSPGAKPAQEPSADAAQEPKRTQTAPRLKRAIPKFRASSRESTADEEPSTGCQSGSTGGPTANEEPTADDETKPVGEEENRKEPLSEKQLERAETGLESQEPPSSGILTNASEEIREEPSSSAGPSADSTEKVKGPPQKKPTTITEDEEKILRIKSVEYSLPSVKLSDVMLTGSHMVSSSTSRRRKIAIVGEEPK